MTKTEMKRQQVARVIDLLENGFNAQFDGTDEGGRLGFTIGMHGGQLSRRDLDVALWDTIPLYGNGFSAEEIALHENAVALEDKINNAIQVAVFGYHK